MHIRTKSLVDLCAWSRLQSHRMQNDKELTPRVKTASGNLRGLKSDGIYMFLGVPYVAAPSGPNRWRAPQPMASWDGVRDANAFGARCLQTVGASFDSRVTEESEDCLFLNVWTATLAHEARRPVLVWIHGGGNLGGAASEDATDGSHLARLGVVVVSFNYRLGALGFLSHPSIGSNFAVLDQIAALRWVQRNIVAFGGDSNNVTVIGQSAGAQAVRVLLSCPAADGLYHRAILQSAGFEAPAFAEAWSAERAHAAAESLFSMLGSNDVHQLRLVPSEDLKRASHELSGVVPKPGRVHTPANLVWMPVPDEELFTRSSPTEWPKSVPVLMGYTANEARYFLKPNVPVSEEVLGRMAGALCGPKRDEALEVLEQQGGSVYESLEELFSTAIWKEPAYKTLQSLAGSGHTVFFYVFGRQSPGARLTQELAKHTAEIRYIFGNLQPVEMYDDVDASIARTMQQAWIAFARTGVPSNEDGGPWAAYSSTTEMSTNIGEHVTSAPLFVSKLARVISTLRHHSEN